MGVLGDLRYALRSLAKSPGFTAVALLTVALGVGANTAVFSLVNAVLLQPLPFRESERLVAIHEIDRRAPQDRREISVPNFLDWQRAMQSVESMAAYGGYPYTLEVGDTTERVNGARVSWNYFAVLGVQPALGRTLAALDDSPSAAPVMVISDTLWRQIFKSDPSIVGRVVRINQTATTIVGVVPSSFAGPPDMTGIQDSARLWVTIGRFASPTDLTNRASLWLTPVIARLRPGVTVAMAQAEMDVVTTGLEQRYPGENRNRGATIVSFNEQYFGQVRPVLFILVGAVGLVLSIACTNLASLLLARGDARQRELAVRSALGAARARVARLVLVESVTVSLLGGLLGLLAAVWLIDLVVALSPVSLPSFVHVSVDARVLAFTFAVCTIAGVVFGLAPAVIGSRGDILQGLKLAGRGSATSGTPSLRRRLVTAQIALALVLAIGAGLMFRTLDRLRAFDPGFRLDGLLTVTISLPPDLLTGQTADKATPYLRALLDRVKTVRGVDSAGLTWDVPLIDVWLQTRVRIVDRDDDPVLVRRHMASPDYFRTLGIPLLEGRDFSARDDRSASQQVAIISRQFADRYWPNGGALHQRLQYNNRTLEIIGVVGDVQHEDLLRSSADPDLYMSVYQATLNRAITFAMRTSDSAEAIVAAIREIVRDIGLGAPIFATRTGEQIFNAQIARQRFMGALLTIFSSVALLVTLVGVYGVASYNVSRRTREIGVRMALGGARGDVLGNILRIELMPIAYGIVFGLVVATGASGALEAFLHEVSPTDPVTFATVAILVAAVALIACLLPARLATRIDPAAALRAE